ncbi:MAG: hypothetical protein ACJ764_06670 [Solirubrobacteraceae bacterium]
MATVAVFVAVGGGAYAAFRLPPKSVGTRQLKDAAVTNQKLATGAVTASKVATASLTGAQVKASTLGTVPNASHAATAGHANVAAHATTAGSAATLTPGGSFKLLALQTADWATDDGTTAPKASYYKDREGFVHLRGGVQQIASGGSNPGLIGVLPPGFRPPPAPAGGPGQESFMALTLNATPGLLNIASDGHIELVLGDPGFVGLDGITFRAGN